MRKKYSLLNDDWHANLLLFQGARADHVRDENSNCSSLASVLITKEKLENDTLF